MVLLDQFPLIIVYVITVALVMLATEIGFRIGMWVQTRSSEKGERRMTSTVVGGMLGLVAFLMAFSIGIVINQHGERKAMVVTEANAVGTAWLRAGFLDEADTTAARDLLREYVEIRLAAAADATQIPAVTTRSEEIHSALWAIMEDNVKRGNDTDIMAIVAESMNDVIDVHALRVTAVNLRLPRALGILLFAATLLSFLLVGVASSVDKKRDTAAMFLFALAFVAVLIVIADLDRPQGGIINVSQAAMEDLLRQMSMTGQ